jgi:hypothetical protein
MQTNKLSGIYDILKTVKFFFQTLHTVPVIMFTAQCYGFRSPMILFGRSGSRRAK